MMLEDNPLGSLTSRHLQPTLLFRERPENNVRLSDAHWISKTTRYWKRVISRKWLFFRSR